MGNKYLKQSIDRLDISCQTIQNLKLNHVENMQQLCQSSQSKLQKIGVTNEEISTIKNEMVLLGLSFN